MPVGNPNIAEAGKPYHFKKGQSGNPKGNVDGHSTRSIPEWINKMLNDEQFTMDILDGKEYKKWKGAPIEAIILAQLRLALQSTDPQVKTKSAELLFKHGAPQKMLLGSDPENPLPVNPVDANLMTQFIQALEINTKR